MIQGWFPRPISEKPMSKPLEQRDIPGHLNAKLSVEVSLHVFIGTIPSTDVQSLRSHKLIQGGKVLNRVRINKYNWACHCRSGLCPNPLCNNRNHFSYSHTLYQNHNYNNSHNRTRSHSPVRTYKYHSGLYSSSSVCLKHKIHWLF